MAGAGFVEGRRRSRRFGCVSVATADVARGVTAATSAVGAHAWRVGLGVQPGVVGEPAGIEVDNRLAGRSAAAQEGVLAHSSFVDRKLRKLIMLHSAALRATEPSAPECWN